LAYEGKGDDTFTEEWIHERFAKSHMRGEWFKPTEEVLAFVAMMREGKGIEHILRLVCLDTYNDYQAYKKRAEMHELLHAVNVYIAAVAKDERLKNQRAKQQRLTDAARSKAQQPVH
jgi:hypothetical protein